MTRKAPASTASRSKRTDRPSTPARPTPTAGDARPSASAGKALLFDGSQPCRESESVDEPIDTTALMDGDHTLKVTVTDAAQNTSVVYDATITTLNAPEALAAPDDQRRSVRPRRRC